MANKKTTAAQKTPLGKRIKKLRKQLLTNGYKTSGTNYSAGSVTLKTPEEAKTPKAIADWVQSAADMAKSLGFTVVLTGEKGLKLNEPETAATSAEGPAKKVEKPKAVAKKATAKKAVAKKATKKVAKKTGAKPEKVAAPPASDASLTPIVAAALQTLAGGVSKEALAGVLVPIVKNMPAKARKELVVTLAEAIGLKLDLLSPADHLLLANAKSAKKLLNASRLMTKL